MHAHKWKYHPRDNAWRCRVRNCDARVTTSEFVQRFGTFARFEPPPVYGLDRIMNEREKEIRNAT